MIEFVVIFKTVFMPLVVIVTLLSEIFFNRILGNIYLSLALISFFVCAIVVVLRYVKATFRESLIFFYTFAFLFIYQLVRYSVSAVRPQIMYNFSLNASQFASFSSCFSLGYAAVQILAGYIISRWSFGGLGILNMLAGLAIFGTTIPTSYSNILIMRTITGICFSAGALGFICSVNDISKKNFNLLFSMGFFIALKFASMTNFILERNINLFYWSSLYRTLGKIAFVIGVGILLLSFFFPKEAQQTNKVSLSKSLKSFLSDPDMLLLATFSALIVAPTYVFQNGWLRVFDSYLNKPLGTCTKFFNDSTAYATILVPAIIAMMGTNLTMIVCSTLATIGTLILLFFTSMPYPFFFVLLAAIFVGIGFVSHSIPNVAISEKFSDERVPMYFAIMNFICMIIGSSVMQKLSGLILSFPTRSEGVGSLFNLLIFLLFCTMAALGSIIFFNIRNRKKLSQV